MSEPEQVHISKFKQYKFMLKLGWATYKIRREFVKANKEIIKAERLARKSRRLQSKAMEREQAATILEGNLGIQKKELS